MSNQTAEPRCDCHLHERQVCDICQGGLPVTDQRTEQPHKQRKHRACCASKLVTFDADDNPVNCGLPCDCDNPAQWVTVPVSQKPPAVPAPAPCVWREDDARSAYAECARGAWAPAGFVKSWKWCPYCGKQVEVQR